MHGRSINQNLTKVFRVHNSISSDNIPNTEMCLQTVTVTPLCFTDSCRQCCSSDPTHVNDACIQTERRPSLQPPFHSVFSEDQLKGQMQVLVRSWSFLLYLNMTFRYYSFAVVGFLGTSLLLSSACFKDTAHHHEFWLLALWEFFVTFQMQNPILSLSDCVCIFYRFK